MEEVRVHFGEDFAEVSELACHLALNLLHSDFAERSLESKGTTIAFEVFRSWHALRGPVGYPLAKKYVATYSRVGYKELWQFRRRAGANEERLCC